tara:strand:+ start:159 stop:761 length:603 start_codon:yes stop_codon:yes gene_type:complete
MISRGLIVSLGTTSLVSVLLFLYFRNRMTSVERKVSMLFKLIEDHHQQQQVQFMQRMRPEPPQQNNLINVSDGESDSGSDTEYETDSEGGKLSIQEGEVKTIELTQKVSDSPFQEEQHPYQASPPQGTEYHNNELDQIPPLEELNVTKVIDEAPKQIQVDVEQNFKEMKIKELKKLCGERGLTKYSHLNKAALVNLLEQS